MRPDIPALVAAGTVLVMLAAACGGSATATPSPPAAREVGPLVLSAGGCSYQGAREVSAGRVAIHMVDRTEQTFSLDVWRLDQGHAYAELEAHIAEEQRLDAAHEPGLGHPTFATLAAQLSVPAGTESNREATVGAGTYGFVCIAFASATVRGAIWVTGPLSVT